LAAQALLTAMDIQGLELTLDEEMFSCFRGVFEEALDSPDLLPMLEDVFMVMGWMAAQVEGGDAINRLFVQVNDLLGPQMERIRREAPR
jgi:hypothetical protein